MADKATRGDLQEQIDALTAQIRRLTGRSEIAIDPEIQTDFVAHGSDEHAAMLGLKKAGNGDTLRVEDWTLEDVTLFGPTCSRDFLEAFLLQKVTELHSTIPETQSSDPRQPSFAPRMWRPGQRFADMTE